MGVVEHVTLAAALQTFLSTDVMRTVGHTRRRNLACAVRTKRLFTPPSRSIVMTLSVCLSVCDHIFGTASPIFTKFLCMLWLTVARSCSGSVAMRYTFPASCMTPCLYVMASNIGDGRLPQWLVGTHHGFDTVACTQIGPSGDWSGGGVGYISQIDCYEAVVIITNNCALVVLCECNRWNQKCVAKPSVSAFARPWVSSLR